MIVTVVGSTDFREAGLRSSWWRLVVVEKIARANNSRTRVARPVRPPYQPSQEQYGRRKNNNNSPEKLQHRRAPFNTALRISLPNMDLIQLGPKCEDDFVRLDRRTEKGQLPTGKAARGCRPRRFRPVWWYRRTAPFFAFAPAKPKLREP